MNEYKRLTKWEHPNCAGVNGCSPLDKDMAKAINRLAELEDRIENKTLVELPCKVGDTVYRVMADKRIKQPYEYKVIGFWYSAYEDCNNLHLARYINGEFESTINVPFPEFNRILFLTKAEAEKRLEEWKND